MKLYSMDSFGTDTFIFLSKLGNNLPCARKEVFGTDKIAWNEPFSIKGNGSLNGFAEGFANGFSNILKFTEIVGLIVPLPTACPPKLFFLA